MGLFAVVKVKSKAQSENSGSEYSMLMFLRTVKEA